MKMIYALFSLLCISQMLFASTIDAATVAYHPPELSISASNEPLISVLQTIAREMNISISYAALTNKNVTCQITKLPVQRAFKNLLGNSNFALEWKNKRVTGLTILPEGHASSSMQIISADNGAQGSVSSSELDRDIAAEEARIEQEAAAEAARIEHEMKNSE